MTVPVFSCILASMKNHILLKNILDGLSRLEEANSSQRTYMDSKRAAEYLGVSTRFFQDLRRLGYVSGIKLRGRVLFRPSDLDQQVDRFKETKI